MLFRLPDGGELDLPIEYMEVKDSLFIPTLKIDETREKVYTIASKLGIKISAKGAIVDGYLGLQIWRLE